MNRKGDKGKGEKIKEQRERKQNKIRKRIKQKRKNKAKHKDKKQTGVAKIRSKAFHSHPNKIFSIAAKETKRSLVEIYEINSCLKKSSCGAR